MTHICNPRPQVVAGGLLSNQGQFGLHSKFKANLENTFMYVYMYIMHVCVYTYI